MRLGVSSAVASTRMGVFNQRFEALFSRAGALGCAVCFAPPQFLPVYLCATVGLWGLLAVTLPSLFHNPPPLWVQPRCRKASLLPLPVSAPLLVWMNVSSLSPWLLDFPAVRFFCQFWLFFVFKLLSFFWLCEEAQCVYLLLHLGRKPNFIFIFNLVPCSWS